MAQVDIVGRLRRHQATMVKDEEIQEKYADIMKTLYVRRSGSICPPWPEMVDPVDRINFLMFWNMAQLLQEISNELSHINPEFKVPSEDFVVEQLTLSPSAENAREHPIFLQVMAAVDNKIAQNMAEARKTNT